MRLETRPGGELLLPQVGQRPAARQHLLKLSADGEDLSVFARGFRHPYGLGVGPDGQVTVGRQRGGVGPVVEDRPDPRRGLLRLPRRRAGGPRGRPARAPALLHPEGGGQLQRRPGLADRRPLGRLPPRRDAPPLLGPLHPARGPPGRGRRRPPGGGGAFPGPDVPRRAERGRVRARTTASSTSSASTAGRPAPRPTARSSGSALDRPLDGCPRGSGPSRTASC